MDDMIRRAARAEAAAAGAFQRFEDSALLDRLADLGDQPQLRALCAATIAAGLAARRAGRSSRLAQAGLRMLIAHEAATLAKNFVKRRIDRRRPRSNGKEGKEGKEGKASVPSPGRRRHKEVTSFPSGHSAGAAAVARAFAREFPGQAGPAAGAAAALALVQIPRCAHYPTDVAAGLAVGLAAEAALAALWPAAPGGIPAFEPLEEPLPCATC